MKKFALAAMLCALTLLTGCGGDAATALGLGRNSPDEFAVVDRPPLALPPDFALRPPQPGATRPQEIDMTKRADNILFGANSRKSGSPRSVERVSDAEQAILQTAGANKAEPNIRALVDQENAEYVVGSDHLVDQLLWWQDDKKPGTVIDSAAEQARINDAKAKGEALNKTPTPVIERNKSTFLGL